MDAPYYTVTVASLTEGWSYSYTHGDVPDPDVAVHLADPFTFAWGYTSGLVPAQLLPCTAKANLWCRDAAAAPAVQIGDLLTVAVRIGTAGPYVIAPPPLRVAAAEVEVSDDPDFAARLSIDLTDTLGDLAGLYPYILGGAGLVGSARTRWRPRMAEIAATIGRSIGCPTWWADYEQPLASGAGTYNSALDDVIEVWGGFGGKSARDLLTALLNSQQPNGYTHVVTVDHRADWPAGYRKVGPDVWWGDASDNSDAAVCVVTEPVTTDRYLIVPASRRTGGHGVVSLDAAWCLLPAKARRSREHGFNTINVTGQENYKENPSDPGYKKRPGTKVYVDGVDRDARGPIARDVPTALSLGMFGGTTFPAVNWTALNFMPDASDTVGDWCYDDFELVASAIPQADALAILPAIAPRFPGEVDGDGQVLRHITIAGLQPSARFDPAVDSVAGFNNAGQLTITGGDMTWQLEMTPGQPQPSLV